MADNTVLPIGVGGDTVRTIAKTANSPAKTQVLVVDIGGGLDASSETPLVAGQAAMAASLPVAIANNQSAVPVSGTVTANAGTGNFNVTGTVAILSTTSGNSPAAVSVGVASTAVLSANASRKGLILVNTSANTISLGFGVAAVLNSGVTLISNGVFGMDGSDVSTQAINAIASVAASNLAVQEFQ